jgi:hypothetical protein
MCVLIFCTIMPEIFCHSKKNRAAGPSGRCDVGVMYVIITGMIKEN